MASPLDGKSAHPSGHPLFIWGSGNFLPPAWAVSRWTVFLGLPSYWQVLFFAIPLRQHIFGRDGASRGKTEPCLAVIIRVS